MTPKHADYIAEGKRLTADEREIAALALQPVDGAERAEIDAAWDTEVGRRLDEIADGSVELVDGEETLRVLRVELAARRHA